MFLDEFARFPDLHRLGSMPRRGVFKLSCGQHLYHPAISLVRIATTPLFFHWQFLTEYCRAAKIDLFLPEQFLQRKSQSARSARAPDVDFCKGKNR
jgi:hypothetical protein